MELKYLNRRKLLAIRSFAIENAVDDDNLIKLSICKLDALGIRGFLVLASDFNSCSFPFC